LVDVDQALAGIDKLLRSQELAFALVDVAPALPLLYVIGGYFGGLFASSGRPVATRWWEAAAHGGMIDHAPYRAPP
jgi:hypothetical protein